MPQVTIAEAVPADLADVRSMLHEYAAWLALDLSFQNFADEVSRLPGDYQPPGGGLWVARLDGAPVGMIAIRRFAADRAEMKRLFVRPEARGTGVGRLLVDRAIAAASAAGYAAIVLDTLPQMAAAQRLYQAIGFRDVAPYYQSPIAGTRYMELTLGDRYAENKGAGPREHGTTPAWKPGIAE